MWAGRLRQDGNAFTALGPARRTAMLKGGSTTQKGKGKGKPVAVDPIVPTKGKGKGKPVAANSIVPTDKGIRKGKGKHKEAAKNAQGLADRVRAQAPVAGSSSDVPLPGRADFPTVLPCKRANQDTVLEAGASGEGKLRMLAAFDRGIAAASSRTAGCALWNTWCTFHSVWFDV